MVLRALAFFILSGLPAAAQAVCDPAQGTPLAVIGVAANDTLNMRAGPSASQTLVSRIRPGERGIKSTGRAAITKGQCLTTCSGEEGGLSDAGRSIAYNCKASGKIWYEVRRENGSVGWASAKFLQNTEDEAVIIPPKPPGPSVQERRSYTCGKTGPMTLAIYTGGKTADVSIGGVTYLVVKQEQLFMRYAFGAGDGARLRGGTNLIEWRWPDGRKVNCIG